MCLDIVIQKISNTSRVIGDRTGDSVLEKLQDHQLREGLEFLREGSSDSFGFELDSSDFVACVALNGWPFTRVGVGPVYVFSEV